MAKGWVLTNRETIIPGKRILYVLIIQSCCRFVVFTTKRKQPQHLISRAEDMISLVSSSIFHRSFRYLYEKWLKSNDEKAVKCTEEINAVSHFFILWNSCQRFLPILFIAYGSLKYYGLLKLGLYYGRFILLLTMSHFKHANSHTQNSPRHLW